MSRYIDADKLHEEIFEETKFKIDPETNDAVKRLTMPISEVLRRINNQPSADVVEVKHGHWVFCGVVDDIYGHGASCSVCGGYSEDNGYYCSCCGAKMDDALQRKKNPEAF